MYFQGHFKRLEIELNSRVKCLILLLVNAFRFQRMNYSQFYNAQIHFNSVHSPNKSNKYSKNQCLFFSEI